MKNTTKVGIAVALTSAMSLSMSPAVSHAKPIVIAQDAAQGAAPQVNGTLKLEKGAPLNPIPAITNYNEANIKRVEWVGGDPNPDLVGNQQKEIEIFFNDDRASIKKPLIVNISGGSAPTEDTTSATEPENPQVATPTIEPEIQQVSIKRGEGLGAAAFIKNYADVEDSIKEVRYKEGYPAEQPLKEALQAGHVGDLAGAIVIEYKDGTFVEKNVVVNVSESGAPAPETEKDQPKSNAAAAAGLVAGLAGLGLLIGGVWHFLNKDGKTLVPSKDRVNAEPTPEEKKKSEELLKQHGNDVKQKTDAVKANPAEAGKAADVDTSAVDTNKVNATQTAPRGMAAETGNNTIARGMAAVAVMALLGAVVFFARRRFVA